jgi:hypothetical protein
MAGLSNYVKETASAPGTSTTFNLGGATAPFVTFASSFSNGSTPYYYMQDATQWECGESTLTHGSPNTLSRTTVLANSVGTTARLNFAGTTTVYCSLPASKAVRLDQFPSTVAIAGALTLPGGWMVKMGTFGGTTGALSGGIAEVSVAVTFAAPFPTACLHVFAVADDVSGSSLQEMVIATRAAFTVSGFDARLSCMQASTAMTGSYIAFGN